MKVICCDCNKEYEGTLYEVEGLSVPIIECPHCGLQHTVEFTRFRQSVNKKPISRVSLTTINSFKALDKEDVEIMSALVKVDGQKKIIDLGCGDGSTMETIIASGADPDKVFGIEIDSELYNRCIDKGLNVFHGDLFDVDCSYYDIVFFWFTLGDGLNQVFEKLYAELKRYKRVVCTFDNRRQFRNGVFIPEESYLLPDVKWRPTTYRESKDKRFYLYIR